MPISFRSKLRYAWKKWFNQGTFTLVEGVDFKCSKLAMVQQIRNKACEYRVAIDVQESEDGTSLTTKIVGSLEPVSVFRKPRKDRGIKKPRKKP